MKTVLCVPGHDEKKVQNCRKYGADLILFDLEDSVPENMKDRARAIVATHIRREDHLRINGYDSSSFLADIDMASLRAGCVWLPKVGRRHFDQLLITKGPIVLVVETPDAVYDPRVVRTLGSHLHGLAFGAADFAAYMNVPTSSPQVQYARQQVALAAAALEVPAYDSPCTSMNVETIRSSAREGVGLGYQWKGAIHPAQIPQISEKIVQHPSIDRALVELYDRQTEAVMMTPSGELIAPPMIRAARKRLEESK